MKGLTHLLDTSMLADLIRHPRGSVATRIRRTGEDKVCTSLVVAAEIRYGCAKKRSEKLTTRANSILEAMTILPLEAPVDSFYGSIRRNLEIKGEPIGPNDLLITAHALALGLTVVTANEAEFSRVPDLSVG